MSSKKSPNNNNCQPRRIGVTGGIGSGKSYVCRLIEEAGFPVFYCDDEAKRIIRTDPEVRQSLTRLVGSTVYAPDGTLVKPVLASYLCAGREHSARVDAIVHPKVRDAFLAWSESRKEEMVFMECALLFESGFDRLTDFSLLVQAPQELRLQRVMQRDSVSRSKALEWMALQMPEEEKARRADGILINDGSTQLREQLASLLGFKIF